MKLSTYRNYRYSNDNLHFFKNRVRVIDRLKNYIKKSNEPVSIEMIQYRNRFDFYNSHFDFIIAEKFKNVAYCRSERDIAFMGMINEHNRCMLINTHYYLEKDICHRFLYNSFHSFRKNYMKSTIQKINEYRIIRHIENISIYKYQSKPSLKQCIVEMKV